MITAFYALERIFGAEIILIFVLLCFAMSFVLALSVSTNRGNNAKYTVSATTASALLGDIAMLLIYFPNGVYVNTGLMSIAYLLIYPVCIAVGMITVTLINRDKCKG